ncbi:MAG: carboxy terminal-processing peptidase [Chitinophagaceae bacterium]|nr:carboxy terminal-processing peptidase [Chitinophagaceae bacterium]
MKINKTRMGRKILFLLFYYSISFCITARENKIESTFLVDSIKLLIPEPVHSNQAVIISQLMADNHYRKTSLDDSLSKKIFEMYLDNLDNQKSYFLESDVHFYQRFQFAFDDYIKTGNLDLPFEMFRLYQQRVLERIEYVKKELLEKEPDFTIQENVPLDRSKENWAKTNSELDEIWRKTIKNQMLGMKLEGKDWAGTKKVLDDRYSRIRKNITQYNNEDAFQIFMNAFTENFDPHSNYFSPANSDNFNMALNQSLEGIGARLTQQADHTVIYEIVTGGPAYKSKMIHKDDKVIAVAQGDTGKFIDVIGWRLDEVVQLIRGPKGTKVRLKTIPVSNPTTTTEIELIREKITLEDESATKKIIPYTENNTHYKIGVVSIPSFYIDFEDYRNGVPNYKSVTNDVKRILTELESEKVDGIVIDLRFNGGGALFEAVNLTGLFIPQGPVVQVKDSYGNIDINKDKDNKVYYDGPLCVLINRFSASASEIFAGAIQDYKRGIVLGENTYGKGTVQQIIGLEEYIPEETKKQIAQMSHIQFNNRVKFGQIKLTLSKFYRVTGSSTQHRGVKPDIEFLSPYDAETNGESAQKTALPWDQIQSTTFTPQNKLNGQMIQKLQKIYASDEKKDPLFQELKYDIDISEKEKNKNYQSLHYEIRKQEKDKINKEKQNLKDLTNSLKKKETKEVITPETTENPIEKDAYLKESVKLLSLYLQWMKKQ